MADEKNVVEIFDDAKEKERKVGRQQLIARFGKSTVTFTEPFEYCGEIYEGMEMDFESLTGRDMEAIDDELSAQNIVIANPTNSHKYQRLLAARAANVPSDMIEQLPLAEYNKVTTAARYFLFATG